MKFILRHIAFSAGFALAGGNLDAQQPAPRHPDMRANSVYTEIGGNFGDFSVNYDRLFGEATVVRIGYGTFSDSYGDCLGIGLVSVCEGEVEMNLIGFTVSKLIGRRHMAELGFGGAFGDITAVSQPAFVVDGAPSTQKEIVNTLTATIGYRLQGPGRWLVRAGYTPSYLIRGETQNYSNHGFTSMLGVSFGLAF